MKQEVIQSTSLKTMQAVSLGLLKLHSLESLHEIFQCDYFFNHNSKLFAGMKSNF